MDTVRLSENQDTTSLFLLEQRLSLVRKTLWVYAHLHWWIKDMGGNAMRLAVVSKDSS
jgi:hypothetical protein